LQQQNKHFPALLTMFEWKYSLLKIIVLEHHPLDRRFTTRIRYERMTQPLSAGTHAVAPAPDAPSMAGSREFESADP
jgi:hypothetical protein